MPHYGKGTLTAAFVHPNGEGLASWDVPSSESPDPAAEYEQRLESAGFRRTDWFMQGAMTGFVYHGHGLEVTVGTLEIGGVTTLDVSFSRS